MADYIYEVSRIRYHEQFLLNGAFLEQLMGTESEEAARKLLNEHGWGVPGESADEILDGETRKTWELIGELVPDLTCFDVFRYENDYHNLKAAIKETCTAGTHPGIFMEDGRVSSEKMLKAVEERDFASLPEAMRGPAEEAMNKLLETRDGQICDCIIDRAALTAIREAGIRSKSSLLGLYGELTCAIGDIKTAVRAQRTGKDKAFLTMSLAPCDTLDVTRLAETAPQGMEALTAYLSTTTYSEAVEALDRSPAEFECWCDNYLIRKIRPQLSNSFGLDPLAAYILARRMEIRSVRIILTGKRNQIPDSVIRGRVRETYV